MSNSPQAKNIPSILGGIASIVGLLGISLYFIGWIYRWAYYGFFQLEVTTLDLPLQSFLLVPLQVFFGSPTIIIKTIIFLFCTLFLIHVNLWLLEVAENAISDKFQDKPYRKQRRSKIVKIWQSFAIFSLSKLRFIRLLIQEASIILLVLIILFWLAYNQGLNDAKRDAFNETSTRPVVAFVTPQKKLLLGRDLDVMLQGKIAGDPSVTGYHLLGELTLFKKLREEDTNDLKDERVWRLLIERGGWIYLFPTLPKNAEADEHPPVIAIEKGGESLMILSPSLPKVN
jgi:hypothetical protein